MKTKQALLISIVCVSMLTLSCTSITPARATFKLRPFTKVKLENGLQVMFIEDHSLPYVSLNLMLDAGANRDSLESSGLTNIVGELMRKGTSQRDAAAIAEELDYIGADFGVSVDSDFTLITASALSFHQNALLQLFSEVALQPRFAEAEVARSKAHILAKLEEESDDADGFADRLMSSFLFKEHPYSLPILGTKKGVSSVTRESVADYFRKFYIPNRSILAVVGKFDSTFRAQVVTAFGVWKQRDAVPLRELAFPAIKENQIMLVDKKSAVQAQVRIGLQGIRRNNSDYLVLKVANMILGGAFSSRLNDRVRDQLGLTYHIGSHFDAKKQEGSFLVTTFTRTEKVREIIVESLEILRAFHQKGVTEVEVAQAKALLKGNFPRSIETAEKLAFNMLHLQFNEMTEDYLANFLRDIERVSAQDVNRAIQQYLDSSKVKVLVYGDAQAIAEKIQDLGKLEKAKASDFQ